MATYSHESEMALFSECMLQCARKVLDSVSIVREVILRQLRKQKADRQDAELILRWLLEGRFPQVWVPNWENRDLLSVKAMLQTDVGCRIRHS